MHRSLVVVFVLVLLGGCASSGVEPNGGPILAPQPVGAGASSPLATSGTNAAVGAAGNAADPGGAAGIGVGTAGTGTLGAAGTISMNVAGDMNGGGGVGAAGATAAGTGGMGAAGTTAPPVTTPTVPALTAECPAFQTGTISFMGLGGISLQAGSKAGSASAPMVFYWHGTGSFAGEYAGSAAAVLAGVLAEGGVLISFQGTTGGDFLSGTAIFGAGDMELSDQLLACAVENHNVDPRRVFATGCSAGGLFSTAMAALRSNYIAAAAPNSGGWSFPSIFQNDWTPALMTIHGAAGVDVVVIDFSVTSAGADRDFKARGGFVINCDHGGFHCGGGGLAPDIWEFFKAHPYGTKPSPWASALPAGFNSDCTIY